MGNNLSNKSAPPRQRDWRRCLGCNASWSKGSTSHALDQHKQHERLRRARDIPLHPLTWPQWRQNAVSPAARCGAGHAIYRFRASAPGAPSYGARPILGGVSGTSQESAVLLNVNASHRVRCSVSATALLAAGIGGCFTAPSKIEELESSWRQILFEEAPLGTGKPDVRDFYSRHRLVATDGTYRTVREDGSVTSNCRLPDRSLSALDRGAVRGLYLGWDIEITVCFDERDNVEEHFVGAWNAGI